jgi:hypothetical protein
MNILWLIIPVLVAFPLFIVTIVSIIASCIHLKSHQLAAPETGRVDID